MKGKQIYKKWKVRSCPEDTEARQETVNIASKGSAQASFASVPGIVLVQLLEIKLV